MSNLSYWIDQSGADYRKQQENRIANNNFAYPLQETWLGKFFQKRIAGRANAPLKVLDFGCGFGRIAKLLCELDGLEYYGFDISPAMTEELRAAPPKLIENLIADRVRTAESLDLAYPHEFKFDVILTVSVLIHNSQENLRRVFASMLDRLAPDGQLVLIENPHTAISAFENLWHGGCWCHSFVRHFDGLADVEIFDNLAGRHAVYLVAPHRESRESRYFYHADPQQSGEEVDFDTVLLRGLNRAVVNADHLAAETAAFGQESGALIGRIHDLSENLSYATEEKSQLKQKLAATQDAMVQAREETGLATQKLAETQDAAVRAREDAMLAKARFSARQRLFEDLASVANAERMRSVQKANAQHDDAGHSRSAESIEWNARRDVVYSHYHSGFEKVLHIFQQEWFGIRAAAGSLPGHKLAISADVDLAPESVLAIYERITKESFNHIIFHGLSENTSRLVDFLAKRGLSELIYMIKHGSPTQWFSDAERRMAYRAIELLNARKVRKLQFMKTGFDYPLDGVFRPLLFNLSPNFG